jgi:hypothetical protein
LENNLDLHVENVPGEWVIVRMNEIETWTCEWHWHDNE